MNKLDETLLLAIGAVVAVLYFEHKASAAVTQTAQAVNPTNQNNIFSKGVNTAGEALTGDPNWTLGVWIYDITHTQQTQKTNPANSDQQLQTLNSGSGNNGFSLNLTAQDQQSSGVGGMW